MQQAAACHPAGESPSPSSGGRALADALHSASMLCLCPVAHLPCPCLPAQGRTLAKQAMPRAGGSSTYQAFTLAAHLGGAWIGMDSPDTAGTHPSHPQPKNNSGATFLRWFVSITPLGAADMSQLFSTSWEAATNIPASTQKRPFFLDSQNFRLVWV